LLPDAKMELHRLLEDKELAKTAVLIVANKIDLEPHASEPLLIRGKNTDAAFFLLFLL
jgi:ADP-ribosylation factor-like protein 8